MIITINTYVRIDGYEHPLKPFGILRIKTHLKSNRVDELKKYINVPLIKKL